jgi:putative hydrolase of the HAD superfamily
MSVAKDSSASAIARVDWPRVRGVVFDLVGTLLHPAPSAAESYRLVGAQFGHVLSEAEAARRFREAFARQEAIDRDHHDLRTSQEREHARWQAIVADVFPAVGSGGPLFDRLWRHFAQAENWQVFADVPAALTRLGGMGMPVAIASNFDARLQEIVRSHADLAVFDGNCVFDSASLGWRKPALSFFRTVEKHLDLPAEALLMVGDDPDNDSAGAVRAGWQALLVGPERAAGKASLLAQMAEQLVMART